MGRCLDRPVCGPLLRAGVAPSPHSEATWAQRAVGAQAALETEKGSRVAADR